MPGENCNCYLIYRLLPTYSVLILLIDNLHNMNMTKTQNFCCFLRLRETGETDQKIKRLADGVDPHWKMERQLVFSQRAYDLSINQN